MMKDLLRDPIAPSVNLSAAASPYSVAEEAHLNSSFFSSYAGRSEDGGIHTLESGTRTAPSGSFSGKCDTAARKSLLVWGTGYGYRERQSGGMRRKSSLRSLSSKRVRKKKKVHFHGISSSHTDWYTVLVSATVSTFRPSSKIAMVWEFFIALMTATDLVLLPLGVLGRMFRELEPVWYDVFSPELARRLSRKHSLWSTVEMSVDVTFLLDLVYRVCRAFVYDMGFHDSPVDRLVMSTTKHLCASSSAKPDGNTADSQDDCSVVCLLCLHHAMVSLIDSFHDVLLFELLRCGTDPLL